MTFFHDVLLMYLVFVWASLVRCLLVALKKKHNYRVMDSVWVLYLVSAIQGPYILHILQAAHIQPVLRLQLLLSNAHYNFIGSSYTRDLFAKMLPIWVVLWVL